MSAMVIGPAMIRPSSGGVSARTVARGLDGLRLTRRGRRAVVLVGLVLAAVVFALGARSAAGVDGVATVERHLVLPGESLWQIAADSRGPGEPVAEQVRELVRLNGLSGDQVVAGQELVVARG